MKFRIVQIKENNSYHFIVQRKRLVLSLYFWKWYDWQDLTVDSREPTETAIFKTSSEAKNFARQKANQLRDKTVIETFEL